jgi:hypothetical protein
MITSPTFPPPQFTNTRKNDCKTSIRIGTYPFPSHTSLLIPNTQALRQTARPTLSKLPTRFAPIAARYLSQETRSAIDKAVSSAPVVLFMKGTPETPQCGFSRATIQILGLQGVDPAKFSAFNVLEDEALRQGISYPSSLH